MVASANGSRLGSGKRIDLEERPYQWSQRWSEDPPPGTTANISGSPGFVELYIGNGSGRRSIGAASATSERGCGPTGSLG